MNIAIRSGAAIPSSAVRGLFVRNRWNDWLSEEDIQLYLDRSYYVVSAWSDSSLVGIAVLVGDGRKYLELENLLVDEKYRRKGIGKALMADVMQVINRAKPYAVKIEVFEEGTEEFYRRFGFTRNDGTWLLELKSASEALRARTGTSRNT
jgi:GNAT superfamily N-acetyltransferase